jgi:hypothetical protein
VFSYLKKSVLPVLMNRDIIARVHTKPMLSQEEIDARLKTLSKSARKTANLQTGKDTWVFKPKVMPAPPKPEPVREMFGKDVGAGEDWSHLNKRRRRARVASVARDVKWMKDLEEARKATLPVAS